MIMRTMLRMRLGNALFEAAKSTKQDELYKKAESAFQEVRNGEGAGIEVKQNLLL